MIIRQLIDCKVRKNKKIEIRIKIKNHIKEGVKMWNSFMFYGIGTRFPFDILHFLNITIEIPIAAKTPITAPIIIPIIEDFDD